MVASILLDPHSLRRGKSVPLAQSCDAHSSIPDSNTVCERLKVLKASCSVSLPDPRQLVSAPLPPHRAPIARVISAYVDGNNTNFELMPVVLQTYVTERFGSG